MRYESDAAAAFHDDDGDREWTRFRARAEGSVDTGEHIAVARESTVGASSV